MTVFALNSYSQSINLQPDATQILQNSDVGLVSHTHINLDLENDLDLIIYGADTSDGSSPNLYKNNGTGTFKRVIRFK